MTTTAKPAALSAPADVVPIRPFSQLSTNDIPYAGGKGANLGRLTQAGLPVPPGFVIGAPAYAAFRQQSGLEKRLADLLDSVDVDDTAALQKAAEEARRAVKESEMPGWLAEAITKAHRELVGKDAEAPVAVRTSATAEDTASASFAGMGDTFVNTRGRDAVLAAVNRCWQSLFYPRAIYYRGKRGFSKSGMEMAVVVQRQIMSTRSGVMFTIDPATGDRDHLVIEGSFGLGEAVVSGEVSPDRYVVSNSTRAILVRSVRRKELVIEPAPGGGTVQRKLSAEEGLRPVLSDEEVLRLVDLGIAIEHEYKAPQDTEWAFDPDGKAWMVQSRPITTMVAAKPGVEPTKAPEAPGAAVLLRGLGAAPGSGSGAAKLLRSLDDAGKLGQGNVLVTHMTSPDWVPLMRKAAAIVTDSGGMTCHAAIVSRELGIPAVVGTGEATKKLRDGEVVTVDATHGLVLEGAAAVSGPARTAAPSPDGRVVASAPLVTATKLLVNLSEPSQVERAAKLDVDGVGLVRAELMLVEALDGTHPKKLLADGRGEEFVQKMSDALMTFAAGFSPRPVTYRTTDFRTNEFRGLKGGEEFEPQEANPMIGFRGALRYTVQPDVFNLELQAITRVWDAGHTNFHVMLPFVRTARELERCRDLIVKAGLLSRPDFELWIMAEVPSVLFNLERYAKLGIAGISIGSNDLTQLLLGADRDSETLSGTFDERDPAVTEYIRELVPRARSLGLQTSICGQAPSVHPEYAELLVRAGIDAISVSTDVVERTRRLIAAAEQRLLLNRARR
jgi:pyruvate, water dikinase